VVPVTSVELRRAGDRANTRTDWLTSAHSFSFGHAYDPDNTHFGLLLASNDDLVAPGSGFATHPHRDLEIVTWVLSGVVRHEDSSGASGLIYPGLAQRMSAGSGVLHSEFAEPGERVHLVQMWVSPDESGVVPSYQQVDVAEQLDGGGLVPIASGLPRHAADTALLINQRGAGMSIGRLRAGGWVQLPAAPFVHVFVARGTVQVEGSAAPAGSAGAEVVRVGDAVRIIGCDGQRVTAMADAEVLVWEMHRDLML
jgi:redox-sensitive bicupin YhaK (pirin superfamily)